MVDEITTATPGISNQPPPANRVRHASIIVFGNEKGGTGKSTTAMHVIVGLLREGFRVGAMPDQWAAAHPEATLNHRLEESRAKAIRTRARRAHRRARRK